MSETIRVLKVTVQPGGVSYHTDRSGSDAAIDDVMRLLDTAESNAGESVRVESVDMGRAEFQSLPDFGGF